MAQLRQDYEQYIARGTEIIVIGPENAQAFIEYWRVNQLPFTGLPDPSQRVLRQYGQEFNLLKLGRMPAQVVIDKQGIIRYAHYGNSMSDIPNNQELFKIIDEL